MIAFQLALLYVCIKYRKSPLPTIVIQNGSSEVGDLPTRSHPEGVQSHAAGFLLEWAN